MLKIVVEFQTIEGLSVGDKSLYSLPFGYVPADPRAVTREHCEHYGIGTPCNMQVVQRAI